MNVVSQLWARMGGAIRNSSPSSNDGTVTLNSQIIPTVAPGAPYNFLGAGQTLTSDSVCVSLARAISNGVGTTDGIANLDQGIWRIFITFTCSVDFLAGDFEIRFRYNINQQAPILAVSMNIPNQVVVLTFFETVFVSQPMLINMVNPGSGAGQNAKCTCSLSAIKIL